MRHKDPNRASGAKIERTTTMATKDNRHGKHRPDKVQFGGMVSPKFKAIAQLTASKKKCSLMALMANGVYTLATEVGIMRNGEVAPEYKEAIEAMADIIKTSLATKRGN